MTTAAKIDPRVDEYLAAAPVFARPILRHLRERIHAGCPGVEETIKWSRPFFMCRGQVLGNMAAFKTHCTFGFWAPELRETVEREGVGKADEAGGQFGRITSLADLPDDATLGRYLAEAVRGLDTGRPVRTRSPRTGASPVPPVPGDLARRLEEVPRAAAAFEGFAPGCRREYIEWITEAKRPETRQKRLAQAVEWMAEGKKRNWQYER